MRSNYDFTFILLTYNHEEFIIPSLESIKFQILNYGNGKEIQLIIAEDCSTDNTLKYIKSWLNINQYLFSKVDILNNASNIGACLTLINAFHYIKGRQFKWIEGDDLFSNINLFEIYDYYSRYTMISCGRLYFQNNKIIDNDFLYKNLAQKMTYSFKQLKLLVKLCSPFAGTSLIFSKKYLNEEMYHNIIQTKLVADRPMWYSILNNNPNFISDIKPIILNRINEKSITSETSDHFKKHNSDIIIYYKFIINREKNLFIKFLIKNQLWCIMHDSKYLNLTNYIIAIDFKIKNKKIRKQLLELYKYKEDNQKYLDKINSVSQEFVSKYLSSFKGK